MATIYDVAKAASVSPKTVSRVLNGDGPVGKSTRASVESAIQTLGYVPSNAARSMRSNRSGLIGLITGALSQKLEPTEPTGLPDLYIVQGIQQVMSSSGKTLMIADTGGQSEKVPELVDTFLRHRAEALIYVADYHQEIEFSSFAATCPVMLVNCFDPVGTPSIVPDDELGQYELVKALINAGHSRIAFLTLDQSMVASQLRSKGYIRALNDHGIPFDPAIQLTARKNIHDASGSLLAQCLDDLISQDEPPTVICCGNDEMALRVYGMLRSKGFQIPQDISVAGFDNYRAIADTLFPPLTTVELPYSQMGRRAAHRILELIKSPNKKSTDLEKIAGPVNWRSSVTDFNSITKLKQSTGG